MRRVPQSQRDAEAAAIGYTWLEPCGHSREKTKVKHNKCGYEWSITPGNLKFGKGCPKCGKEKMAAKRKVSQSKRDAQAAAINCKWLEECGSFTEKKKIQCKTCKHEWLSSPDNIRRNGCPKCAREKVANFNRASQKQRDKEAAAVNCKWLEPCKANNIPCKAQCLTCNYVWHTSPSSFAGKSGCPICAGVKMTPETWHSIADAIDCEWIGEYKGSTTPNQIRCKKCGNEWETYTYTARHGNGCLICNPRSFKWDQPTTLYFVKKGNIAKIGITATNGKRNRVQRWLELGWDVVEVWEFDTGNEAYDMEQSIIKWWREDLNLKPAIDDPMLESRMWGGTETVLISELPLQNTIDKVSKLVNMYKEGTLF